MAWMNYYIPHKCMAYFSMHHYGDVIMSAMASQIASLTIVCAAVYPGADQKRLQSSASSAFVRGIHQWPVNSPHKGPVTRKMFPFDDVIMTTLSKTLLVKRALAKLNWGQPIILQLQIDQWRKSQDCAWINHTIAVSTLRLSCCV